MWDNLEVLVKYKGWLQKARGVNKYILVIISRPHPISLNLIWALLNFGHLGTEGAKVIEQVKFKKPNTNIQTEEKF